VASGPYALTDWTPGTNQWLLQENPAYWGGPSIIKQLQMSSAIDITSRALQIAGNPVDYVYDLPPVAYNQLPPEVQVYSVPLYVVHQIVLNNGLAPDHPLQNRDVRHAMSLAIDRDGMNKTAFFGLTTPCTSQRKRNC
jgi:peptide/nickel transport system substrate-binding protein